MKLNKKEIEAILGGGIEKFKEVVKEKKPDYFEPKTKKGWFIGADSCVTFYKGEPNSANRNLYPTKKDAEMALAMCELIYLRDEANGQPMDDWCDWEDDNTNKYSITRFKNRISVAAFCNTYNVMTFKTSHIRDKFLKDNETLIKKAFGLE